MRTVPGTIDVTGLAPAAATVTVNGSSTGVTRHGDWYFRGFGVTNTSTAVWQSLTIASSLGGSAARFSFVPLTPEVMAHDPDGNLTSDGRWDYTCDAENRLLAMQTRSTVLGPIPNTAARRLEFKNDYLGRRVQKTVRAGWNGSSFTSVLSDTRSLYHGWNLIHEYDALNSLALVRRYIWGLDWSGTLQGAGAGGGLLASQDPAVGQWFSPAYDGNGNVMALLNRSDGTVAAAYEYDAFGNTLRATGTAAATNNPFRFSTKYTDTETGLIYYGLRYYSPGLGRFINRDPIEEQGGMNLYAFVGNNGVNSYDYLGMVEPEKNKSQISGMTDEEWRRRTQGDLKKIQQINTALNNGQTVTVRGADGKSVTLRPGDQALFSQAGSSVGISVGSSAPNRTATGIPTGRVTYGPMQNAPLHPGEFYNADGSINQGGAIPDFWAGVSPEAAGRAAGAAYDTQQYWAQRNSTQFQLDERTRRTLAAGNALAQSINNVAFYATVSVVTYGVGGGARAVLGKLGGEVVVTALELAIDLAVSVPHPRNPYYTAVQL